MAFIHLDAHAASKEKTHMPKQASGKSGQSYLKRFLFALPAAAALCLTFFFFGPMEMVMTNSASFQYDAIEIVAPIMGVVTACAILLGSAFLALFRGKLFNVLVAVCLAFALCLYAQGAFLNGGIPSLSGDNIDWQHYMPRMLVNTFIWLLLFSVPFVLLHFKDAWKTAALLLPVILIVMQLSGIVSLVVGPNRDEIRGPQAGYMTNDQIADFSTEQNVLVFMLDRMDYNFIAEIEKRNPGFFDRLDGFTCYDNAISQFAHTRPGANFMLTGYDATLFKERADDYFKHSWDDGERHILQDFKNAGYDIDLYGEIRSLLGTDYESFRPYVNNIKLASRASWRKLAVRMAMLSGYRDFPYAMKPFFRFSTDTFNNVFSGRAGFSGDEAVMNEYLPNASFTSDTKFFKFYEFKGSHSPYTLTADGQHSSTETDALTQTMGAFEVLMRIMDRLKAEGAYKDTAIVITADHGVIYSDYEPLEHPTLIGMFYKPAGVEGTPLERSNAPVSLRNVPPTLLKNAGLDYSAYGTPLDEVPDDASIVRDYCHTIADKDGAWIDTYALYYDVGYDAQDLDSWKLRETVDIEYPLSF